MSIIFRPSQPDEAAVLSDIAIESKGHWGYSREQLEVWRKDLRILPSYIKANTIETIWQDELKVGFFAIKLNPKPILDHLWLLPKAIGRGIGKFGFSKSGCHRRENGGQGFHYHLRPSRGRVLIFTWELNASEKSPVSRRIECCQNYSTGSKSNKICPQILA